jgi:Ca2+-transporting ATPase
MGRDQRSALPNPALTWILLIIAVVLGLSLLWPAASALFRFGPLHADDLALTLATGIGVLIVLEMLKHLWRARLGL